MGQNHENLPVLMVVWLLNPVCGRTHSMCLYFFLLTEAKISGSNITSLKKIVPIGATRQPAKATSEDEIFLVLCTFLHLSRYHLVFIKNVSPNVIDRS